MADQEAKPKASITNIYYDCLERIFDFLDLKDLLNVANTCKRLQIAAAAKFGDEYGKKRVYFRRKRRTIFNFENGLDVSQDAIYIVGPKFQLPLLRCFGAKISHFVLKSDLYPDDPYMAILSQYINQYCADTLTTFGCHASHVVLSIEKPFKNVEKLEISGSALGYIFPSFVNWFPSLRHLDMIHANINTQGMAVNFPNLEHLSIPVRGWTIQNTADLLNANLQLQSLGIWINKANFSTIRLEIVLNMLRANQLISKLNVKLDYTTQVYAAELVRMANEHPLMVELILPDYQFTEDNVIALIGQLSSLKKFEFRIQGEAEFNRLRNKLNGEWHFEHKHLGGSIYVIVLNRKIVRNNGNSTEQKTF